MALTLPTIPKSHHVHPTLDAQNDSVRDIRLPIETTHLQRKKDYYKNYTINNVIFRNVVVPPIQAR